MFIPLLCIAQADHEDPVQEVIEYIADNSPEDRDYSEITERLNYYKKHPLNINLLTSSQLQELIFLSPLQIEKFIQHRDESGTFHDILELQSIDGFSVEIARWLANFLVLNPPELFSGISLNRAISRGEHDLILRVGTVMEKQIGFVSSDSSNAKYSGSPERIFARYRFNYSSKIAVSLNMEKDAGERFLGNGGRGFDFYSANIFFRGKRLVKKLVVGDYSLQFGQGLALWSGLGFGKGAGLTTVVKQGHGLSPYSSVNESSFLRGTALTIGSKSLSITPFISYNRVDAVLTGSNAISSISISGLHRTPSELQNKNLISQLVYGANAQYLRQGLLFGLSGYRSHFSKPFGNSDILYKKYDFTGRSLTNVGLYYAYSFKNAYFFGEAAKGLLSGSAFLTGVLASLSGKVSGLLLYRNYARDYHSLFNQGLSESTKATNERGIYAGLTIKFNPKTEFVSYFDLFRFPWLKFQVDAPSQGHEMLAQLSHNISKKFKISGRFKFQQKEENADEASVFGGLENVEKQSYRIELAYKLNDRFSARSRLEISSFKKGITRREFGVLSYQDIIYKPLSSKFAGNIRFAMFETGSFNSRIYAYENDVLYGYSVPAYQGKGLRTYFNGRYSINRGVDVWIRYAISSFLGQDEVGSGNDKISGNSKSDLKLQLRLQF
ncbi:Helix-hairpin-helix motif-containing protein [Daejeonella lutea]|uniref:Helix-hairpin-helix motif-containing protein n=2 Tax=Daejeonella lutea TaxID=572036 RepID=A0A1T5B4S3_9SPHI|nr:Helix-hairpin-helix motif-containing protein [Daejeonella lutea]